MKTVTENVLQNKMQHVKCDGMPIKMKWCNTDATKTRYLGCVCYARETFSGREILTFMYFFSENRQKPLDDEMLL